MINIDYPLFSNSNPFYNSNQNLNPYKNFLRNVYHENLLYTPKVIENDDEVKKNISEQIKSVIFVF